MLYGAIIGDIVGSIYECRNLRSKKFPFFAENGFITDDSCMTIALASAIKEWKENDGDLSDIAANWMRNIGNLNPDKGYGGILRIAYRILTGGKTRLCVYSEREALYL